MENIALYIILAILILAGLTLIIIGKKQKKSEQGWYRGLSITTIVISILLGILKHL